MCQTFPLLCSHSTIYIPPIASYLFSDSHILLKMPVNFKREKIIHREFRFITANIYFINVFLYTIICLPYLCWRHLDYVTVRTLFFLAITVDDKIEL